MLQSFTPYPSNQHRLPGDSSIRVATFCPQLSCLCAISSTWQHFHSLQGYIHIHTRGYRYFTRSWSTLRTHKVENQNWSPILSLLSDLQSPLDLQTSPWPLSSPHSSRNFMTMPKIQHHKLPPKPSETSFPAEAANSQMLDQSCARKKNNEDICLPFIGL